MDYIKIGEFLKALRKAKGLTQQDVADELYVTQKTISRWERGDGIPDINTIATVAKYYGVTVDELLNGEKSVKQQSVYTTNLKQGERLKLAKNKLSSSVNILGIVAISIGGLFLLLNLILGLSVGELLGLAMGVIGVIISYAILIVGIKIIKGRREEFDIELDSNDFSKLDSAIRNKALLYYDILFIEAILSLFMISIYLITGTKPEYMSEGVAFSLFILFTPALYIYIRRNTINKPEISSKNIRSSIGAILAYASIFLILVGTTSHFTYIHSSGDSFSVTEEMGIQPMLSLLYTLKGEKLFQIISLSIGLIGITLVIVFFMLKKPYLITITGLITTIAVPFAIMDYYSNENIQYFYLMPTMVGIVALIVFIIALICLITIDASTRKKRKGIAQEN